jgi:hypothetical protein
MASEFATKGWYYIPNIITKSEAIEIKYKNLQGAVKDLGSLDGHFDPERGRVLTCYAPPSCAYVMKRIQPMLEDLLKEELIPTYWFSTTYHNKGWMNCHTDRPSCEVSVTMNICGDAKWPIKLKDLQNKKQSVITPPGDGLAYLGTIVEHWRSPMRSHDNDKFMQLFLHFVRKNGQHAEWEYDKNQKCYDLLNRL